MCGMLEAWDRSCGEVKFGCPGRNNFCKKPLEGTFVASAPVANAVLLPKTLKTQIVESMAYFVFLSLALSAVTNFLQVIRFTLSSPRRRLMLFLWGLGWCLLAAIFGSFTREGITLAPTTERGSFDWWMEKFCLFAVYVAMVNWAFSGVLSLLANCRTQSWSNVIIVILSSLGVGLLVCAILGIGPFASSTLELR